MNADNIAQMALMFLNLVFLVPAFVLGGAALFVLVGRIGSVLKEDLRRNRRAANPSQC